ncbi:MAG: MFS transporter [Candidatus Omnitrophica bacterium]|nr:MFS transporter [Candidatus Omnitrophota bacterium]
MEEKKVNRGLLFILANGVYFFSYFHRVAVPGTIFNEIQSEFLLSATAVAGLSALTFFMYGGIQIFGGIMSDRFGGFRTFFMGSILLSISSILFSFSYSPAMLFITRAFIGLSAGIVFTSLIKILSIMYKPEDFPFYLSIMSVLGYTGGVFATFPLERAVSFMGWRNSFLLAGLLCLIIALSFRPFMKSARRSFIQKTTFSLRALLAVLKNKNSLPVIVSGPINFSIYFLFQTTLGAKHLQDSFNVTPARAAFFTFIMMIINTGSVFLSGYTSKLIGLRRPIIRIAAGVTLSASILLFFNISFIYSTKLVLFSYVLLAVSAAAAPVFITTMKEMNTIEVAATSVGFLNSIVYIVLSLLVYAAGRILDVFSHAAVEIAGIIIYPGFAYRMVFLVCIMLAVCSFLVCFPIKETGSGKQ